MKRQHRKPATTRPAVKPTGLTIRIDDDELHIPPSVLDLDPGTPKPGVVLDNWGAILRWAQSNAGTS